MLTLSHTELLRAQSGPRPNKGMLRNYYNNIIIISIYGSDFLLIPLVLDDYIYLLNCDTRLRLTTNLSNEKEMGEKNGLKGHKRSHGWSVVHKENGKCYITAAFLKVCPWTQSFLHPGRTVSSIGGVRT